MMEVEVRRRAEWIEEWFGPRCDDNEDTCVVCQAWGQHDLFVKTIANEV